MNTVMNYHNPSMDQSYGTYHCRPYNPAPIIERPYQQEDKVSLVSNLRAFSVSVKPEIRNNTLWAVSFSFSHGLLESHPIRSVNVLRRCDALNGANVTRRDCYSISLKVRSKLIFPVKELEFSEVANFASDSLKLNVDRGNAFLNAKFTKRPRKAFHKHSDVMILVATLYNGHQVIAEDTHELVFRGGTGSSHSSQSKQDNTMLQMEYLQQSLNYQSQMQTLYSYNTQYPSYETPMTVIKPECEAVMNHNCIIPQNFVTPPQNVVIPQHLNTTEDLPATFQLQEEFPMINDLNTDFLENPDYFFLDMEGYDQPTHNYYQPAPQKIEAQPEIKIQEVTVNNVPRADGTFEGTALGTFLEKTFGLHFEAITLKNGRIEGSFSGSFH